MIGEMISGHQWRRLPALRAALEDKRIPDSYYLSPRLPDNMFDSLQRLLELAILAKEYKTEIVESAQTVGIEEMYRELDGLHYSLKHASSMFKDLSDDIEKIGNTLRPMLDRHMNQSR
jgi:hypothetical protein